MDLEVDKVLEVMGHFKATISLNLHVGEDNDTELGDLVGDRAAAQAAHDADAQATVREELEKILSTDAFTDREAGVIRDRYGLITGEPKSSRQVAALYGVSRERIRQLELRAMGKLRAAADHLRPYLT
jgi:RNA polymerase primary sigma factor